MKATPLHQKVMIQEGIYQLVEKIKKDPAQAKKWFEYLHAQTALIIEGWDKYGD